MEAKLNLIKETNPDLFDRLKDHIYPDNVNFQLINSESGDPNLFYNNIALHCTKNPQAEALKEFNRISPGSSHIVILMGIGLGYCVKRFFQNSKCKIIIFEPDLNILKFTLEAVDFSQEINSERFFITNTPEEVIQAFNTAYSYKNKVVTSKLPASEAIYPEKIEQLMSELDKTVPSLISNYTTMFKLSWGWLYNGLCKLKNYKKASSFLILENKFQDKAALIVSAGPSLDKNIELIKQNREKFIIFCANVVYKKLIAENITPDFIIYLDPGNLHTIKNHEHSDTNIILHSSSCKDALKELKMKNSFIFYCNNDLLSRWISKICGFSLEKYMTKGSVSQLGLLAAYNMGCNPIILTGQDLAFTDGKFYSSGSFWGDLYKIDENQKLTESEKPDDKVCFEKKKKKIKETNYIKVKGQNGDTVLTSSDYAGFIRHFEEFAEEHSSCVKLINCSQEGANIEGFENREFSELVNELAPINLNMDETLEIIVHTEKDPVKENIEKIKNELEQFQKDNEKIIQITDRGVKACQNLLKEVRSKKINPANIKKAYTEIIESFNRLDDILFNKYEFAIALAYKELTEFKLIMEDDSSLNDINLFINFAKAAQELFKSTMRTKMITINVLPLEE